jgi:tripartite-type tricarboxylate transporter receptor subunit TctC
MQNLPRRNALLAIVATTIGGSSALAQTASSGAEPSAANAKQTFPWRVVQIIVPSPAGSPPDLRARELTDKLAPLLARPVIVLNKPGAGGAIGMQAAAASAADGHTIVVCTDAPLTTNPSLYERLPYDPVRDFAPVMIAYETQLLLVARRSLPADSIPELIRLAKTQPGGLIYGSPGSGTRAHVLVELLRHATGLDLVHVPYKGGPASTAALLAGDVSFTIDAVSQLRSHIASGALKALAVTGNQRLSTFPNVPTFAETGIKGMDGGWTAVVVPSGTPHETVMRLNRDFRQVLDSPPLKASYLAIGLTVVGSSPEELAKRITEETPKWRDVIKRAGITPG